MVIFICVLENTSPCLMTWILDDHKFRSLKKKQCMRECGSHDVHFQGAE